jgi:DNA helicase-2/ATP-dependent DNA helicase PcrA
VIAGAGTGKTMTLAARVARLVRDGCRPEPPAAADLLAPRRQRDGAPRRRLLHAALGLRSTQQAPVLPWSRHLSQHRGAAAARGRRRIGLRRSSPSTTAAMPKT